MEIFIATSEDARGIKEVQYKTWLVTYPNEKLGITIDDIEDRFKNAFSSENIIRQQEKIRNFGPNTKSFVAKEGSNIVGFCTITREKNLNKLNAIYVLPEFQGKGIGQALWGQACKFLDPAKDTFVEVASYNVQAINFYKKLGFAETGREFQDNRFKMKSGAILPEMEMIIKVSR